MRFGPGKSKRLPLGAVAEELSQQLSAVLNVLQRAYLIRTF